MSAQSLTAILLGLLVLAGAAPIRAQSLADVAKKEEERRKQMPKPARVYTNKDLGGVPPSPAPVTDPNAADTSKDSAAKNAPAKDAAKDAKDAKDPNAADGDKGPVVKDQKYWSEKMKTARDMIDRDSTLADALQSRINGLTTDFVNRDDPAQKSVIERDRQKALAELDRLKKQVTADKKAVADLEEEARRAGVPPGWIR